ncbi:MAG: dihydropteroate synthase, partial [Akkermansiaceae bacterium]
MKKEVDKGNSGRGEATKDFPVWRAGDFEWNLSRRALVMGILNVTPDSFSDGGDNLLLEDTLSSARRFVKEGADILDIGGESTRPGAETVPIDKEIERIQPVIEALGISEKVALSIDTSKPEVARVALEAGAHIVNDVTGFRDGRMIELCAPLDCGVVIMHMQGTPGTMQRDPRYSDVVGDVRAYFEERFETLVSAGIAPERIVFDPGIGFGKTLEHNLSLIAGLKDLEVNGRPLLMGLSRKSFLGLLVGRDGFACRE